MGGLCQTCQKIEYNYDDEFELNDNYEIIACIIKGNNKTNNIGFLGNLHIPHKLDNLSILITINQNLEQNDIEINKTIKLFTNYNQTPFEIKIDHSRIAYLDKDKGISIIGINKDDGISFNNLLDICYKNPIKQNYKNSFYLLLYEDKSIINYKCQIKNIDNENQYFEYECENNDIKPLAGSPIIMNYNNIYQIIGMHKEINDKNKFIGFFLKKLISKFFNEIDLNKYKKMDKKNIFEPSERKEVIKFIDEITLRYKIEEDSNISLFGD